MKVLACLVLLTFGAVNAASAEEVARPPLVRAFMDAINSGNAKSLRKFKEIRDVGTTASAAPLKSATVLARFAGCKVQKEVPTFSMYAITYSCTSSQTAAGCGERIQSVLVSDSNRQAFISETRGPKPGCGPAMPTGTEGK